MHSSVDWADPCAALAALRPAYYELIGGARRVSVQFDDRRVDYAQTNIDSLRAEMVRLESECAAKNGTPRRRFAIQAGSRRMTEGW